MLSKTVEFFGKIFKEATGGHWALKMMCQSENQSHHKMPVTLWQKKARYEDDHWQEEGHRIGILPLTPSWLFGESQDCPPQDWPHGGQSWGGQSWALSVIRIAHLNYNTIFSLPAWFRVVTIDSGCFEMISTYLIQSASMFNWFIIRFIMDTQIHKKVQLNIFTHWVICLSSIQLWKGKWAGRGLLYKYIFSSVHPA